MALHHKLCHTLGGSFGMPHAQTHTVVLPYAIQYNQSYAPAAMKIMARALGGTADEVADRVQDISRLHGGPTSLKELGFKVEDLDQASEIATQNPYYNPRPVTQADIRDLLGLAFEGIRPK